MEKSWEKPSLGTKEGEMKANRNDKTNATYESQTHK